MDFSDLVQSPLDPERKPYWQVLQEHQQLLAQNPDLAGTTVPEFAQAAGPGYEAGLGTDNFLRRLSGKVDIALHHFGGAIPGDVGPPTFSELVGGPHEGWDLPKLVGGAVRTGAERLGAGPEMASKLEQVGAGFPRMAVDIGAGAASGGIGPIAGLSALSTYGETGQKLPAAISGLSALLIPKAAEKVGGAFMRAAGAKTLAETSPDLLNKATGLLPQDEVAALGGKLDPNVLQKLAGVAGSQVGMFGVGEGTEIAQTLAGEGDTQQKIGRIAEQFSPSSLVATGFAQLPWTVYDLARVKPTDVTTRDQQTLTGLKQDFAKRYIDASLNVGRVPAPGEVSQVINRQVSGKPPATPEQGQLLRSIGQAPIEMDLKRPVNTATGEWPMPDAIEGVKARANGIAIARPDLGIDNIGMEHDYRIYAALRTEESAGGGKLSQDELARRAAHRVIDTMTKDSADLGDISPDYRTLNEDEAARRKQDMKDYSKDVEISNRITPDLGAVNEKGENVYDPALHQKIALLTGTKVERQDLGMFPRTELHADQPQPILMSARDKTDPTRTFEVKDNLLSQIVRDMNSTKDPVTGKYKAKVLNADATFAARRAAEEYNKPVDLNDPESVRGFYEYVKSAVQRGQVGFDRSGSRRPTESDVTDPQGNLVTYPDEVSANVALTKLKETKAEEVDYKLRKQKDGTYKVIKLTYPRTLSMTPPKTEGTRSSDAMEKEALDETFETNIPKTALDQLREMLPHDSAERNRMLEQFRAQNEIRDPAVREARKMAIVTNVIDFVKAMPDGKIQDFLMQGPGTQTPSPQTSAKRKALFVKIMQFMRDGGDLKFEYNKTEASHKVHLVTNDETEARRVADATPGANIKVEPFEGRLITYTPKEGEPVLQHEAPTTKYTVYTKTGVGGLVVKGRGDLEALNKYLGDLGFADPNGLNLPKMRGLSVFDQFHILSKYLSSQFINPNKVVDFVQRPRGDFAWQLPRPEGAGPDPFFDNLEQNVLVRWPKEYKGPIAVTPSQFGEAKETAVSMRDRNGKELRFEGDYPLATLFIQAAKHHATVSARELADMFKRFAPGANKDLMDILTQLVAHPFGGNIRVGFGVAKDTLTKGYYHHGDDLVTGTGILLSPYSDSQSPRYLRALDRPENVLPHLVHELAHAHTVFGYHNDPAVKAEVDQVWQQISELHKAQMGIGVEGKFTVDAISHALSKPEEMLASVFNNGLFREYLKTIPDFSPRGGRGQTFGSVFDRIMDVIRRVFARLVGDAGANTMLQRVSDVAQLSMRAQENLRERLGIRHEGDIFGALEAGAAQGRGDLIEGLKPQPVPKGEEPVGSPWSNERLSAVKGEPGYIPTIELIAWAKNQPEFRDQVKRYKETSATGGEPDAVAMEEIAHRLAFERNANPRTRSQTYPMDIVGGPPPAAKPLSPEEVTAGIKETQARIDEVTKTDPQAPELKQLANQLRYYQTYKAPGEADIKEVSAQGLAVEDAISLQHQIRDIKSKLMMPDVRDREVLQGQLEVAQQKLPLALARVGKIPGEGTILMSKQAPDFIDEDHPLARQLESLSGRREAQGLFDEGRAIYSTLPDGTEAVRIKNSRDMDKYDPSDLYVLKEGGQVLESRVSKQPLLDSMKAASEYLTEDENGQWFKPLSFDHFRRSFGPTFGDKMTPEQHGGQWGFRVGPDAYDHVTQADLALAPKPPVTTWAPSAFEMMKSIFVKNGESESDAEALAGYNMVMASLLQGTEKGSWGQLIEPARKLPSGQYLRTTGVANTLAAALNPEGATRGTVPRTVRHEQTHLAGFVKGGEQYVTADVQEAIRSVNSIFRNMNQAERDTVIDSLVGLTNQTGGYENVYSVARSDPTEFAAEFMSHVGQGLGNVPNPNAYMRDVMRFVPDELSNLLVKTNLRRFEALDGLRRNVDDLSAQRGLSSNKMLDTVDELARVFKGIGREAMDIALDQADFYRMRNLYPDMYKEAVKAASDVVASVSRTSKSGFLLQSREPELYKKAKEVFGFPPDPREPTKPSWWNRTVAQVTQFADDHPVARPFVDMMFAARGLHNIRLVALDTALAGSFESGKLISDIRTKQVLKLATTANLRNMLSKIALDVNLEGDKTYDARLKAADGDVFRMGEVNIMTPEYMDAIYRKYGATPDERATLDTVLNGMRTQIKMTSATIVDSHLTGMETIAAKAVARATNLLPEPAREVAKLITTAVRAMSVGDHETALAAQNEFVARVPDPKVAEGLFTMVNDSYTRIRQLERFLSIRMPYYFSERRAGDYGLWWRDATDKIQSTYFKSGELRNAFIKRENVEPIRQTNPGDTNYGIPDEIFTQLNDIQAKMTEKLTDLMGEKDAKETAAVMDMATELRNVISGRDVLGVMSRRKLAKSRDYLDMFDSHLNYVNGVATAARNRQMRLEADLLLDTPEFANQPIIKELLKQHLDSTIKPDTPLGTFVSMVNFVYFMGLNLSNMILEPFQQLSALAPMLTKSGLTVKGSYEHLAWANAQVIASKANRGRYKDPELQRLMERARVENVVDQGIIAEMDHNTDMQIINRIRAVGGLSLYTPFEMFKNRVYQAANMTRKFYGLVPAYNSEAAFAAAYKALKGKFSGEQLYSEISHMVRLTMLGGGKFNRPIGLFANVPRSAAQAMWSLQSYSSSMMSMMGRMIKDSTFNPKGLTPAQTAQTRKAAVQMLGTQFVLAGALGMPFAQLGMIALQKLFPQENIEKLVRDFFNQFNGDDDATGGFIGSALATGIPSALSNAPDMGSRFALSNVLGVSPYSDLSLNNVIGPTASVVTNLFKAVQAGARGDPVKTAEQLMPRGPLRIWKSLEQGNNFMSPYGTQLANDLSPIERFGRMVGFTPARVARIQDAQRLEKASEDAAKEDERQFVDQTAKMVGAGQDQEAHQAITQRALESKGLRRPEDLTRSVAKRVIDQTMPVDLRNFGNAHTTELYRSMKGVLGTQSQAPSNTQRMLMQQQIAQRLGFYKAMPSRSSMGHAISLDRLLEMYPNLSRPQAAMLLNRAMSSSPIAQELTAGGE